jgi:hypothetical protein
VEGVFPRHRTNAAQCEGATVQRLLEDADQANPALPVFARQEAAQSILTEECDPVRPLSKISD